MFDIGASFFNRNLYFWMMKLLNHALISTAVWRNRLLSRSRRGWVIRSYSCMWCDYLYGKWTQCMFSWYNNNALAGVGMVWLQWYHNGRDGVSNHQPDDCLLNRGSNKISKLRATGLCRRIHRWPVNSSHKGPVARKMFPFDDVIIYCRQWLPVRRVNCRPDCTESRQCFWRHDHHC